MAMAEIEDINARLCVVESTVDRHCDEIGEVRGKVASLEICVSCLPDIKDSLKNIQSELKTLGIYAHNNQGKSIAYFTIREWAILAIATAGFLINYFVFK
jgi:hypothetical protein